MPRFSYSTIDNILLLYTMPHYLSIFCELRHLAHERSLLSFCSFTIRPLVFNLSLRLMESSGSSGTTLQAGHPQHRRQNGNGAAGREPLPDPLRPVVSCRFSRDSPQFKLLQNLPCHAVACQRTKLWGQGILQGCATWQVGYLYIQMHETDIQRCRRMSVSLLVGVAPQTP